MLPPADIDLHAFGRHPERVNLRILLADDDDDQVVLTRRALAAYHRPLDIEVVRDGTEVITRLTHDPLPHLVLLDLHMPRMTGLAVLQALRADARYEGLPVVVLSASLTAGDEQAVRRAGATDFLPKLSNLKRFSATLSGVLDRLVT